MKSEPYIMKNSLFFSIRGLEINVLWAKLVRGENESLLTRSTRHTFYELEFAFSGPVVMELRDHGSLTLPESDFSLIPPDVYHQVTEDSESGERFITAFSVKPVDDDGAAVLSALSVPTGHRATPAARALAELIVCCGSREGFSQGSPERALFEAFIGEILAICAPFNGEKSSERKKRPVSGRIREMIAYVEDRGGVGIGVNDLARRFGVTARHLSRLLSRETGMGAQAFIAREKQKRIEALLASTRLSLKEIADLCGFSDEYAMNKFFKRQCALNPSQFRLKNASVKSGPRRER